MAGCLVGRSYRERINGLTWDAAEVVAAQHTEWT
jgi:hypothetical protein